MPLMKELARCWKHALLGQDHAPTADLKSQFIISRCFEMVPLAFVTTNHTGRTAMKLLVWMVKNVKSLVSGCLDTAAKSHL